MYGIFTYIWAVLGVNVGKYTIIQCLGILDLIISIPKMSWSDLKEQKLRTIVAAWPSNK